VEARITPLDPDPLSVPEPGPYSSGAGHTEIRERPRRSLVIPLVLLAVLGLVVVGWYVAVPR